MACGLEFYRRRKIPTLAESDETQKWTKFLNDLFDDVIYRRYTYEGIKKLSCDLNLI